MSRRANLALGLLCWLLLSCSGQQPQWHSGATTTPHSGQISYRGQPLNNGLGGSGKTLFATPENGLGGTGQQARNGLGGTGSPAQQQQQQATDNPGNGLGGSGQQAGRTTIIGSVSAFGSIWVNNRHILLPDDTRYFRDGEASARAAIRLGQVVAVLADEYGDDYQAVEVHAVNNVTGPLQSIQTLANGHTELQILGQRVLINQHTRLLDQQQQAVSLQQLKTGQWLTVSGLRTPDQSIRASLIQPATQQIALLAGPLSALDGDFVLGEQRIQFGAATPELDQPLTLTGALVDGDFIVADWHPMPLSRLLELADEFWLEGFPVEDAGLYLEGFEVQLPDSFDQLEYDDSISIGFDEQDGQFWLDDATQGDDYLPAEEDGYPATDDFSDDGFESDDYEYDDYEYDDYVPEDY